MEKGNPKWKNPPIFDIEKVSASNDCTGLIPSAVETEAEAHNYADLYGIHSQKPTKAE